MTLWLSVCWVAIVLVVTVVTGQQEEKVNNNKVGDFIAWAAKHGRGYSDHEEFQERFEVFCETDRQMQEAI